MVAMTRVRVLPERRKEFFQSITPLTQRMRKEKGCLSYRLYEETGDENSLLVIEEWEAQSYWNEHRNGADFAVKTGLLEVLSIYSKMDFKLLTQVGDNTMIKDYPPSSLSNRTTQHVSYCRT